jgi:hypothetical protein
MIAGITSSVELSPSGEASVTSRQARSTAATWDWSKCTWPPTSPPYGRGLQHEARGDAEVAAAAAEAPRTGRGATPQ